MTPSRDKPLVILGAGGHAKVVFDMAVASHWQVRGFLDGGRVRGETILAATVLGNESMLDDRQFVAEHAFVVAIGQQKVRRTWSLEIISRGGVLAVVSHPGCVVSPYATIHAGTVIAAGCVVNPGAAVGRFCILNTGCTVDHDVVLADGVQICPGANLAGTVSCGEDVFVGTGAVIIPRITIGAGATVGAGAVVIRDVAAGDVVVGNPARSIGVGRVAT